MGRLGSRANTEKRVWVDYEQLAGQLFAARLVPGGAEASAALAPRVKTRMREVQPGRLVAYQGEEARRCRLGKVVFVGK